MDRKPWEQERTGPPENGTEPEGIRPSGSEAAGPEASKAAAPLPPGGGSPPEYRASEPESPGPGAAFGPALQPAPIYPAPPEEPPRQKPRRQAMEVSLLSLSLATVVLLALLLGSILAVALTLRGLLQPGTPSVNPPAGSFSVITIQGDIFQSSSDALGISESGYQHGATVEYVKQLAKNDEDKGILLRMNTPGGGVYESDELYRALEAYHEETGRPVWAYMGQVCASGGYYICMGAQHIMANYNTTTGSIGVYIALTDTSGLYEMFGVETVLVRSGEYKGTGVPGTPITDDQRAVYQSSVDESYARFLDVVEKGRGMGYDEAHSLADGRTYTAQQALDNGLVDELGEWETILNNFKEETGAKPYYPSFSRQTVLGSLLSDVLGGLPQNEAESVFSRVEALPQGVPLAYAPELAA